MNPYFCNGGRVVTSGGGIRKDKVQSKKVYYVQQPRLINSVARQPIVRALSTHPIISVTDNTQSGETITDSISSVNLGYTITQSEKTILPVTESIITQSEESILPVTESILPVTESILPVTESILPVTESIITQSEESILPVTESIITQSEESILPVTESISLNQSLNDLEDIVIQNEPQISSEPYTPILCGESLNLHFFDHQLGSMTEWVRPDIDRVENLDVNEKVNAFATLKKYIMKFPFQVPDALSSYDVVSNLNDFSNIEPITKLSACSLLYLLYEKIVLENNEDCLDILIIQLIDMRSGMCSQGRVTRLLQTVVMFDNFA